nr:MAG TPA: hypothetical protein [Caudoviricetes sp.]
MTSYKIVDHRIVELQTLSSEVIMERLERVSSRRKEITEEIKELDKIQQGLEKELSRRGR